jgi:hypothetical protein
MTRSPTPEEFFAQEMGEKRRAFFERGDYAAFVHVLMLCFSNERILPEWVQAIVIAQAEEAYATASIGPGRHGNWQAKLAAIKVDHRRYEMVAMQMNARRREGRAYVSELARAYGYGSPTPGGSFNRVTREDIFKFVSQQLRGTPARGTPAAIEESYEKVLHNKPKRKRKRGGE